MSRVFGQEKLQKTCRPKVNDICHEQFLAFISKKKLAMQGANCRPSKVHKTLPQYEIVALVEIVVLFEAFTQRGNDRRAN